MTTTCVCLMAIAGCNHDGRYLRPASPDQNASISTTAAPTTIAPGFDDGEGTADGEIGTAGGGVFGSVTEPADPSTAGSSTIVSGTAVTETGAAPLSALAPWRDGSPIDSRYTCDGLNVSPPLSWSAAPDGTVEIALTLADEQNADFVHWTVAGLDPSVTSVAEAGVPEGAIQGVNGSGTVGYTGPCPPSGETHTYLLTVHYLSAQIELGDGAAGADMLLAINADTLASAQITGTYTRA
jgi:Raf kinase inhibitor-like YbhB/YbcL family protein